MVPNNLGTEKIREKSYGDQIGLEKKSYHVPVHIARIVNPFPILQWTLKVTRRSSVARRSCDAEWISSDVLFPFGFFCSRAAEPGAPRGDAVALRARFAGLARHRLPEFRLADDLSHLTTRHAEHTPPGNWTVVQPDLPSFYRVSSFFFPDSTRGCCGRKSPIQFRISFITGPICRKLFWSTISWREILGAWLFSYQHFEHNLVWSTEIFWFSFRFVPVTRNTFLFQWECRLIKKQN